MAENDPVAYQQYVGEQMKQAGSGARRPSSNSNKPGAILTTATLNPQRIRVPRLVVIAIFACDTCSQPGIGGRPCQEHAGQARRLEVNFRVW